MTLFYWLYLGLLVFWVLPAWQALRLKGPARIWLIVVALAGVAAMVWEIWIYLYVVEAIRVDILLISILLLALYGSAAVVLFVARRPRWAALLSVVLIIIGAGMSYEWIKLQRESARLSDLFEERNALLFEAKFRDGQAYQSYFGPFEADGASYPAGHWLPDEGYYKRLIINARGDVWLFYGCGETECALRTEKTRLQPVSGRAAETWQTDLKPPVGEPVPVTISREGPDRLKVTAGERQLTVAPSPPPVGSAPAPQALSYLGTFAHSACRRQHSDVRQVWLWREGDRLFAVGIFSTLVAGQTSRFVQPVYLGEGERRGEAWAYAFESQGSNWEGLIAPDGDSVSLSLKRNDGEPVDTVLERQAIVEDEVIELAPLSSVADWQHWFDVILVGHFSTAEVPKCV
jgi:hypothetical protein